LLTLLVACADSEKPTAGSNGGNTDLNICTGCVVTGSAFSAQGELPLIDGVAYANSSEDGKLYVVLSSFVAPGCDADEWLSLALDNTPYIYVTAGLDSLRDELDVHSTWGDGQTSGSGGVLGKGSISMTPDDADILSEGEFVTGELYITPLYGSDTGAEVADGTVSASFTIPFCGQTR